MANSADPSIAKALYSSPLMRGQPSWIAVHPVPIERRPCVDFLWQQNPFHLDGGGDPQHQQPGVDLLLPYWLGRAYGLFP